MAKTQTADKKVLRNLKKLFTSRDYDLINQGHEVLRSLGDADICNIFWTELNIHLKTIVVLFPTPCLLERVLPNHIWTMLY